MKCLMCESLSLTHICPVCQELFLTPSLYRRKLPNGVDVISFYKYSEIKKLLHTKHTDLGYYIYKLLAKNSMQRFATTFTYEKRVTSIAIDDNPKESYSHTALLNKALKSEFIEPKHSILRAKNPLSYSGKSKEFRLSNPRAFEMKSFEGSDVIVVDDIVTTGSTLQEAIALLKSNNKEALFCLALCDVSL